jgi:SAM-dependent methyltransferase
MVYYCRICGHSQSTLTQSGIRDWEYGASGEFAYAECVSCKQVQLHPFPSMEDIKHAYPSTYPAYVDDLKEGRGWLYSILYALHTRWIIRGLKKMVPMKAKVLDVGCGNGDFLCFLREAGAKELYGVDFSSHAVAIARKKGVVAQEGLFLNYTPHVASFDMIVMNHYIEHVLDPLAELKNAYLLLNTGGILHGTLPNYDGLDRIWFGRFWGGNHVPRHTFQFSPNLLKKHLHSVGFNHVAIRQDANPGHIAISIQNWLQRNKQDLANNPSIRHGRMKGFGLLLLITLPLNIVFTALGRSGVMTFHAVK